MINNLIYRFVTLPVHIKAGCVGSLGVFFTCICLFLASIPGVKARQQQNATATSIAIVQAKTAIVIEKRATAVAQVTATMEAKAHATATMLAAPTATALAEQASTATAIAQATATMETALHATATQEALVALQAQQTAEAQIAAATATAKSEILAQQATATAKSEAEATATIQGYVTKMPSGWWMEQNHGITVAVGDFRYTRKAGYYTTAKGARFVAFGISVFNDGDSDIHVNPNNVSLVDSDGSTYSYDSATFSYWSDPLPAVNVSPGDRASGGIVFVIPSDSAPAKVIYRGFLSDKIIIDLQRVPDQS